MNEVYTADVVKAIRSSGIRRMFVAMKWDTTGWGLQLRPVSARLAHSVENIMWGMARPFYGPN